jgi:hypothetical protein
MTSPPSTESFGVWLGGRRAGTIRRYGDRTRFSLDADAGAVGIDVPEVRLVPRDLVDERLPAGVWPEYEEFAHAIRRLDRDEQRGLIHIEDLAQVRNVYPEHKYDGNFETVASLIYRGRDTESLVEFTRRLTFSVLISNADYHLKNWSLIYPDGRIPRLSPAYVSAPGCRQTTRRATACPARSAPSRCSDTGAPSPAKFRHHVLRSGRPTETVTVPPARR